MKSDHNIAKVIEKVNHHLSEVVGGKLKVKVRVKKCRNCEIVRYESLFAGITNL